MNGVEANELRRELLNSLAHVRQMHAIGTKRLAKKQLVERDEVLMSVIERLLVNFVDLLEYLA